MNAPKEHTRFYVSNANSGYAVVSSASNADVAAVLTTAGQIAVIGVDNKVYTTPALAYATTGVKEFRLAILEATTDPIRFTDIIDYTKITKSAVTSAVNAAEKVAYIGYIGSGTSSIEDPTASTDYIARIVLISQLMATGNYPLIKEGVYKSLASGDTRWGLCAGIYKSLVTNFAREKDFEQFIKFEMLSSEAGTSTITATLVHGSKTVTVSTSAALAAGALIRVGAQSTATLPVYRVASVIDSTTITLTTPYMGISSASALATTCGYIAVPAVTSTTYYGIKMTGVPRKFAEGDFKYQKADWTVNLGSEWATTTYVVSTAANKGIGTIEEVLELERQYQQNEMMAITLTVPPIKFRKNANLGTLQATTWLTDQTGTGTAVYTYWTLEWYDDNSSSILTTAPRSLKRAIFACGTTNTTTLLAARVTVP